MSLKKLWQQYSYVLFLGWLIGSLFIKPSWIIVGASFTVWLFLLYFTARGIFWLYLSFLSFQPETIAKRLQISISNRPIVAYPYIALGLIHARKEEWSETIPLLEQAVKLASPKKSAHFLKILGQAYRESGSYEQALQAFTSLAKAYPISSHYVDLALTYLKMNQLSNALEAASKAHSLEPEAVQPVLIMGKVHFAQKQFLAAKGDYEWALSHIRWPIETFYWLGRVEFELSNYEKAFEHFQNAVDKIGADPLLSDVTVEETKEWLDRTSAKQ